MTASAYIVGAGFTKALERTRTPVPLMMDFVQVMTRYARTDDVVLMALIGLEAMACYRTKRPLLQKLASGPQPKQHRWRLLWHIRRRPQESIEELLLRAEKIDAAIPPMTPSAINAAINDPVLRAQYAINRMFFTIGWKLKLAAVTKFLAARCGDAKSQHTFVSFNYDLALERALENAGVWAALRGYGVRLRFRATADPANLPGPRPPTEPRRAGHGAQTPRLAQLAHADEGALQTSDPRDGCLGRAPLHRHDAHACVCPSSEPSPDLCRAVHRSANE